MELNNLNGEHTKRSRKRTFLRNYSKFAIPDSLISDRLINSFSERERGEIRSGLLYLHEISFSIPWQLSQSTSPRPA